MVTKIAREELIKMMDSKEAFKLVDVLAGESYKKEHIKGAISLPVTEVEQKAGSLLKKNEKIVVYCAGFDCQASTEAAEKLKSMGYENVFDYKGGLREYKETSRPMEGSLYSKGNCDAAGYCRCA